AFSMRRSTMAGRLMAFESALRTRTSFRGFLIFEPSLAVMNGVSSRHWSIWKDDPVREALAQRHLGIALEPRNVRGRHFLDHVHIARQQSSDARRSRLDRPDRHLRPLRFVTPVVVI